MSLSTESTRNAIIRNHFNLFDLQGNSPDAATGIVQKMGYIQIDSINRVERAHHHILFSRDHRYRKENLDTILKNREVFEGWGHAMSILPISEYKYHWLRFDNFTNNPWYKSSFPKVKNVIPSILDKIKAEGPLSSSDFPDCEKIKGGWNTIKVTKLALHLLQMQGKLMISKRNNFRKYYDLPERVIPSKYMEDKPKESDIARYVINKALTNLTILSQKEISNYLQIINKREINAQITEMVKEKILSEIFFEDLPKSKFYCKTDKLDQLNSKVKFQIVRILSPFDNIVIQRKWLEDIFGFYYRLECYLPEKKRKFGFFSLPILFNERFVGSMDCGVERKEKVLKINNISLNQEVLKDDQFRELFKLELIDFCDFNNCENLIFSKNLNRELKLLLREIKNERY